MVRSSPARSNIRPLVLTAVAEGRSAARPPRHAPAVILPFPGARVEPRRDRSNSDQPARPARPALGWRARAALMLAGALAGLAMAGLRLLL